METGRLRRRPPNNVAVLPSAAAKVLVREAESRFETQLRQQLTESEGQSAGIPGQGPAPPPRYLAGGEIMTAVQASSFTTMEFLDRVLPEESWFLPTVTPQSPVQFQVLAFRVPHNTALWLFDYEFAVYRPSGIDPGDFIRAEDGRFSNTLGFDIEIDGRRPSALSYQLDPRPATFSRPAFDPPTGARARRDQFNRATAGSFASTAGPGKSLLPARREVQGARDKPFTFIVDSGTVGLNCVIFNAVRSPLSCIEARIGGYLIGSNLSNSILDRARVR